MGLITLVYSVLLLWAIIHLIHRLITRHGHHTSRGILPSDASSRVPRRSWLNRSHYRVTLQPVHLRLETTGFNDLHDTLASYLTKQRNSFSRNALVLFYNIGSMAGAVGMLAALGLLVVTTYRSSSFLLQSHSTIPSAQADPAFGHLYKRDDAFQGLAPEDSEQGSNPPLQIIVRAIRHPRIVKCS